MRFRRGIAVGMASLCCAAVLVLAPAAGAAPTPLGPAYGAGTVGGAAGQLNTPGGVAVDGSGNLYVADTFNDRIAVFDAQGAFLRAYGWDVDPGNAETGLEVCTASCKPAVQGGGAGQLSLPFNISVDVSGNVYVADSGNERISAFTAEGAFLRAFGFDVVPGGGTALEVCTTTCKTGVTGGGPGQLNAPRGISVDASGNVYVADQSNHRVSVFTAQGAFLRAFGFDVVPGGGAALEVCTTSCKAGVSGGAAGQLAYPPGVEVDGAGNLFVADFDNSRISAFTTQGAFLRAFGYDVDPSGSNGFEVCTLITSCKAGLPGGGAGQLALPYDVAADAAGNVYVADQSNNRASVFNAQGVFLNAFGFDVDPAGGAAFEVCTTVTGCKAGVAGTAAGQLSSPRGIGVDCRGAVYVSETVNHRIQRFGEPGTLLPPCATPPAPPPPPGPPPDLVPQSNRFTFGKLKRNKDKGTAKLAVKLPGPGEVVLAGRLVKSQARTVESRGETNLPIKSQGKARKRLKSKGEAKLNLLVTFTPNGGEANEESKTVKLKRKG